MLLVGASQAVDVGEEAAEVAYVVSTVAPSTVLDTVDNDAGNATTTDSMYLDHSMWKFQCNLSL